jgi:hypothetical protein
MDFNDELPIGYSTEKQEMSNFEGYSLIDAKSVIFLSYFYACVFTYYCVVDFNDLEKNPLKYVITFMITFFSINIMFQFLSSGTLLILMIMCPFIVIVKSIGSARVYHYG